MKEIYDLLFLDDFKNELKEVNCECDIKMTDANANIDFELSCT